MATNDGGADKAKVPPVLHRPTSYPWFCDKPTLRILFYTDDLRVSMHPNVESSDNQFGVAILYRMLRAEAHDQDLVDLDVTLLNRHLPTHGATRLTDDTLAGYDEVWFFTARWEPNSTANPHRELDEEEVAALTAWMETGGVLITGDHANGLRHEDDLLAPPNEPSATLRTAVDPGFRNPSLLGLGRSVGHRVPRAGLLRRWEGGPPQDRTPDEKNVNTQVKPSGSVYDYDDLAYQEDEWPQRLILTTYPAEQTGLLSMDEGFAVGRRRVHRLFCGRSGPIDVFPDHMHEGEVLVPNVLSPDVWPSSPDGRQATPEVVARGVDQEAGTIHDMVVAYDGNAAAAGRIVADSTWHHYFNVNLKGFPEGGSVLTQLAQYYLNLAVWLAPAYKRREIACWLRWQVIRDPSLQMSLGNAPRTLGRIASGVVRRRHGPCVVSDLVTEQAASTESRSEVRPPPDLLVGNVIDIHVRAMARSDRGRDPKDSGDVETMLANARAAAFDQFHDELSQTISLLEAHHPSAT